MSVDPFNTYREQLSSLYHGLALWDPRPVQHLHRQPGHVSIGDVGYLYNGAFMRMFNVTLPWDHPSNKLLGNPGKYDAIDPSYFGNVHDIEIREGEYCSPHVFKVGNIGADRHEDSLGQMYQCKAQDRGALLSLPHKGRRKDVIPIKVFQNYIRDNVDNWFRWSKEMMLPVEHMEDLIFVTGCTLVTSWAAAAFDGHMSADSKISLEAIKSDGGKAQYFWRNNCGNVEYHNSLFDPKVKKPLPQNQCVFIRGFRAKRTFFRTRAMRAAAEPLPDDPENYREDEIEVTGIPDGSTYRDPLSGVLDYIVEKCHEDASAAVDVIAIAHDDDLQIIEGVETLTADAIENFLREKKVPVLIVNDAAILVRDQAGKEPLISDEKRELYSAAHFSLSPSPWTASAPIFRRLPSLFRRGAHSPSPLPSSAHASTSEQSPSPFPRGAPLFPWSAHAPTFGRSPSPFPRSGHSLSTTATAAGELFLFGGYVPRSGSPSNDLYVISTRDFSTTLLKTSGDVPSPRFGHSAVLVSTTLLIWGGETDSGKNTQGQSDDDSIYLLDLESRKWARVRVPGPGPGSRYYHTMTLIGSELFVFGGKSPELRRSLNDIWALDLNSLYSNPLWKSYRSTPGNKKPHARCGHVSVTTGNRIIIFGGYNGRYDTNDTWSFDILTREWTELTCTGSIPHARQRHAAALTDDIMYVFGGSTRSGTDMNDLIALNLSTLQWTAFQDTGPSPSRRWAHAMASDGKRIFVLGGKFPQGAQADEAKPIHILDTRLLKHNTNPPTPRLAAGLRRAHSERRVRREDDYSEFSSETLVESDNASVASEITLAESKYGSLADLEQEPSETRSKQFERDRHNVQLTSKLSTLLELAEEKEAETSKSSGLEQSGPQARPEEFLQSCGQKASCAEVNEQCQHEIRVELEARKSKFAAFRSRLADSKDGSNRRAEADYPDGFQRELAALEAKIESVEQDRENHKKYGMQL